MHKRTIAQQNSKKPPLINLSSDEDTLSEDETYPNQNRHPLSQLYSRNRQDNPHPLHNNRPTPSNPNSSSKTYKNKQFSTLSLDEGSLIDNESLIRSLTNQNHLLSRQNQKLNAINQQLRSEVETLNKQLDELSLAGHCNGDQLQNAQRQIEGLKHKNKVLQQQLKKVEKKCDNLAVNHCLPNKKQQNQESVKQAQGSIFYEMVKQICTSFLCELSKQKMSIKVENIITDFINSIVSHSLPSATAHNISHEHNSFQFTKHNHSFHSRGHLPISSQQPNRGSLSSQQLKRGAIGGKASVSNDYRLLEKSIEKLKNMEREIDEKNCSYLKKQQVDDSVLSRSIVLDTSICVVDRSKSKRKKIFQ